MAWHSGNGMAMWHQRVAYNVATHVLRAGRRIKHRKGGAVSKSAVVCVASAAACNSSESATRNGISNNHPSPRGKQHIAARLNGGA